LIPEKQKQFIESYEGTHKGRYFIMYLTIIGIAGGEELMKKARKEFGRPQYLPDQMYPTKEAAKIVMYAVENGVSALRIGKMVAQTFMRSRPEMLEGMTAETVLDIISRAYSSETDYSDEVVILEQGAGRGRVKRKDNPMPCEFFQGLIEGFFAYLDVPVQVKESKCQWRDDTDGCIYEVKW